ncbi:MAG: HAMP domain-containing histidine kinase [Phycisphaerae bacterium]|nr:HAMP domain-containing histidine kinase [Phycisphaerae bacterium]
MSNSSNTTDRDPPSSPEAAAGVAGVVSRADSAQVAHELNNLLDGSLRNISLALAQLVPTGESLDSEAGGLGDEAVGRLQTAGASLKQMAQVLEGWMRGGTAGSDCTPVAEATVQDVMEYARRTVEPLLRQNQVNLVIDLDTEISEVSAGPLATVLVNALRNALDVSPVGGRIDVRGRCRYGRANLLVMDDGPGLVPELPRDESGFVGRGATTKPDGHGIGLAISRQAAEAFAATLALNDRPGGGAVLHVSWDVVA